MDQSPRLALSYVAPSQAQKHVTVNETFRRLDALTQLSVRSRTEASEPGSPVEGDGYIMPSGASGSIWDDYDEGDIAVFQDGAWTRIVAMEGLRAWVADDEELVVFDGAAWSQISGAASSAAFFGVNATADATNRLAVKSDAVLFSHDDVTPGSGDVQVKVNKAAAGDTASHLFQTNFSGRAEFGLTGDDDFHVKVSANGSSWTEAIWIDKDNGDIGLGTSAPAKKLHILSADNNDGFVLETTNTSSGRVGFDLVTGYSGNADDYFRFNFRGDNADLLLTVRDESAAAWHDLLSFDYLNDETNMAGALILGGASGGGKGAGTINAKAVYDDNTLLSCYVFDQAVDGAINIAKWDGKVPDRIIPGGNGETDRAGKIDNRPAQTEQREHAPLRRFVARIGGAYDPLTLDGYAKHWREKRHLTSMPNEASFDPAEGMSAGAWIQRLVETVEIQAVLIEQLNARLKAVEPAGRR